ncbi:Rieske 2Fe-2S domain-containing protein [Gordonia sp. SID5947]|uniref:Rieske 2Fe-2S domain-containing protein n=1 Tax=Gordonia sp. SID5947 TaxID=2690315 RepID=UPI00136AFFE4|nr:Rieske 2Fe-2S domain-containing protein [Gordonia sp. SID5947]
MSIVSQRTRVGVRAEVADNKRIMAHVDGREIVVFEHRGRLYGFENLCPHMGGPVCEGKLAPRVEAVLDSDGAVIEERFDKNEWRIVCPWHGVEFKIEDGVCAADPKYRLRRIEANYDGDDIYVS